MVLIKDSGITVKSDFPSFGKIKKDLTYNGYDWDDTPVSFDMYEEIDENTIKIPRFYPMEEDIIDNSVEGENINIISKIVPRNDRQKKSIDFLISNNKGILKLEPGSGKTVIAIDAISKIQKKCIIFVHKDSLRRNWKDEFLKHTNIQEEDISFLSTKKFEKDLDKPIIISTIQTFISGLKNTGFKSFVWNSGIGMAIFDECHQTVGPEQFSKTSLNINCKRIYGLSATPIRFKQEKVLNWHLGEVTYFDPEEDELIKPLVFCCYLSYGVIKKYPTYLNWGGKFQYSRYYKQMPKINETIEIFSKIIRNCFESKRTILILGHNVNCLVTLAQKCNLPKDKVGIFIPSSTKEQRLSISDVDDLETAFKTKTVVFSTYGACRDGNNKPELDCLIMITPTSNVQQAGGRILRYLKDKSRPIIIDLIDTDKFRYPQGNVWSIYDSDRKNVENKVGIFIRSSEKRKQIYDELGWNHKDKIIKKEIL